MMEDMPGVKSNYSYFPVFIDKEVYGKSRDKLYEILKSHNIYGRRYFYPLISAFSPYRGLDSAKPDKLPVAEKLADRVICLPMYHELTKEDAREIVCVIGGK
jgi:dTDP-4-amino-4,6-dideoxygalactose transaminase